MNHRIGLFRREGPADSGDVREKPLAHGAHAVNAFPIGLHVQLPRRRGTRETAMAHRGLEKKALLDGRHPAQKRRGLPVDFRKAAGPVEDGVTPGDDTARPCDAVDERGVSLVRHVPRNLLLAAGVQRHHGDPMRAHRGRCGRCRNGGSGKWGVGSGK